MLLTMRINSRVIKEYSYLFDAEIKKKFPLLFLLIFISSLTNIVGLGLISLFLQLVFAAPTALPSSTIQIVLLNYLHDTHYLYLIGCSLAGLFIIKIFWAIYSQQKISIITSQYLHRMQLMLLHYYQYSSYSYHLAEGTNQMVHKMNLIDNFANHTVNSLITLCFSMLTLVGMLVFLFFFYPLFTLIFSIGILSLFSIYFIVVRPRIVQSGLKMDNARKQMNGALFHALTGLNEIRVLGRESFFSALFKSQNAIHSKNHCAYHSLRTIPKQLIESTAAIFLIILFIYIFNHPNSQDLFPILGIFAAACIRLLPIVNNIIIDFNQLHHNKFSVNTLYEEFQTLEKHYQSELVSSNHCLPFSTLHLKNISFKYPTSNKWVLNETSFVIKKGETIGLIGASGVGKTTLVHIILGLLKPESGSILVDNKASYNLRAWLNNFAYIPQISFIFNDSLKRNIALGVNDVEIDEKKIKKIIQQTQLSDVVASLPMHLNTILGEQGIRLSGGQRQRVALARALYFDREVIIMDEATSALDRETEYEIIKTIQALKGVKTFIIITHRVTTLNYCDEIYQITGNKIKKVDEYSVS